MRLLQKSALIISLLVTHSGFAEVTLPFDHHCTKGNRIVIAAVGDLLLHRALQMKASQQGFESLWKAALPYLRTADITYANLEGPIASGIDRLGRQVKDPSRWDLTVYSDYPQFNYHPSLAVALKNSGFDIVSTANNHALDRSALGVDKTIEVLNQNGVKSVGTRNKDSQIPRITQIEKQGIKVAWIACTEHTNGITDKYHQVLTCHQKEDKAWILKNIQALKQQVDAVVVSPHWGIEYQHQPTKTQTEFAHEVLEAGAIAVIGSHPHVLQPLQKYLTQDGRETVISYSLGNFVSFQGRPNNRMTAILLIGLTKTQNKTVINSVRFVPMYMENRSGVFNSHLSVMSERHYLISNRIFTTLLPMGNALFSSSVESECAQ